MKERCNQEVNWGRDGQAGAGTPRGGAPFVLHEAKPMTAWSAGASVVFGDFAGFVFGASGTLLAFISKGAPMMKTPPTATDTEPSIAATNRRTPARDGDDGRRGTRRDLTSAWPDTATCPARCPTRTATLLSSTTPTFSVAPSILAAPPKVTWAASSTVPTVTLMAGAGSSPTRVSVLRACPVVTVPS